MSNLAGSYKAGIVEATGADRREQERLKRLLDGREPSPQPIFGEPVKVESTDETARRIKKTLGDVNQMLTNAPKNLIGIARTAPTPGYPPSGHQGHGHPSNSHPMSGHPSNSHSMSGHPNSHSMSGNSSNSHSMSGHLNSHPMSGHSSSLLVPGQQSNANPTFPNPFTANISINAHSMISHQPNTHPMTQGHPTNSHPLTGHPSSSHPISGHPSSSHPISGHPSYNPSISGHPSNSHLLSGHSSYSRSIPGHPSNSLSMSGHTSNSHLITGHPSNIHAISGHTKTGLPSDSYHLTGPQTNAHPIPGHPISNSTASVYQGVGTMNASLRPQAAPKKVPVPPANNMPKPRPNFNRQKQDSPISSKQQFNTYTIDNAQHQSLQPNYHNQDARAWNTDQKKSSNAPYPVNMHFSGGNYNTVPTVPSDISMQNTTTCAPIWSCGPETPAIQVPPFHLPPSAAPPTANKPIYNIPGQNNMVPNMQTVPKVDNSTMKRPLVRPSLLKFDRKPASTIGVETILKEMTKPVPAPLTAIQTPRTEETGFAFPPEPKEELPVVKIEEKANLSNPSEEQKPAFDSNLLITPPLKAVSPFPNLQLPNEQQSGLVTVKVEKPAPTVTDYTSSLKDDLMMSDSDEEVVPPETIKDPTEYLKSPSSNPVILNSTLPPLPINNNTNMENNSASSSSSESGDSDSDDDSSESNNSDSSSESSDEDTSSKKWGLSNFVDESRRNHSPAFRNLEMQKQLNNANPTSGICPPVVKENLNPLVSEPLGDFIVVDTSITAKSEILSPIRSPAHAVIGPRTPPSPIKEITRETEANANLSEIPKPDSLINIKPTDNSLDFPNEDINLENTISVSVANEEKENGIIDATSNNLISEIGSSLGVCDTRSLNDDILDSHSKGLNSVSEKDTPLSETKPSPNFLSQDALESYENYSIKTRLKVTPGKKTKSVASKKASNNSHSDESNSPPIAKFKHPRACRKSNEKPIAVVEKTEQGKESKKRLKPLKQKESVGFDKTKSPLKSINNVKKPTKTNIKQKNNLSKIVSKSSSITKKTDLKKKKFTVTNFLQSPTPATSENLSDLSPLTSNCEKLLISENKKHQDVADKPSNLSSAISKSSVKCNSKINSKSVSAEKLRRSARCSERASSLNQPDTPSTPFKSANEQSENLAKVENSSKLNKEKNKKALKKSKSHVESLPLSIEPPLQILSPIPHDSPALNSISELGDQVKIMVSIPLNKLIRIPTHTTVLHQIQEIDSASKTPLKASVAKLSVEVKLKKDGAAQKSPKSISNKNSQSKEYKDKPRIVETKKNNKKSILLNKKESSSKLSSELKVSKTASIINKNTSKLIDKSVCVENQLPKKRKSEEEAKPIFKKKPKLTFRSGDERKSKELSLTAKSDSVVTQNDSGSKPKPLERCDSASSLKSLCNQRNSKSSAREKKDSAHDSKRLKITASSANPVKEIKQEKEERSKVHIKKESSALDKSIKLRDKSVTDIDCKEMIDSWRDSLNTSSQYGHWEDIFKDDSKVSIENMDNLSRDSTMNWDHFSLDMHKEMKEASAFKMLTDQGPIKPIDYYWTEGRKMKKLAELEENPFQQVIKFFEAAVLYILTSQQKEENSKNPDAVYNFYSETLSFTTMMLAKIKQLQPCPGNTEFKLLILCLKCQSLLNVKLYNLKIKEIKEQIEVVTDFLSLHCSVDVPNPNLPSLHQSRISSLSTVSSPHSVISPSPSSVSSQTSGYVSGESGVNPMRNTVCVPLSMCETIYRQHTYLKNLHMGHDLWDQADMYMTRSNLKEFFKEVAEDPLTLHSTIKELVSYMQKSIGLFKNYLR